MIDAKALLSDLQKLLEKLEDDIRTRCQSQAEVDQPLREQYAAAKAANRTAQAYEVWRDEQITQAAVAWILGCVFVRFCEDNHLIDPPRLSGPTQGGRRQRAEDEHTLYFQKHPTHSDREYLQWVFDEVARLPAMKELFDKRHNPLWSLGVSGDGAMALREFFLRRDAATGLLVHDFSDPAFVGDASIRNPQSAIANGSDPTRFLGDLYQDLSESARKKYALLQTPIFVEEFILDHTLSPAIREFGFNQVRMIDPTCGSGHFLLGGFHRLFDLWTKHEPSTNVRKLAQNALDQVFGVDLNPYAVAIARFRLLVAALRACGIERLADAPAFTINLAAGDSLLHGPRLDQRTDASKGASGRQLFLLGEDPLAFVYETEDAPLLKKILGQQYHAVVGNPPYIVVRDKALNNEYRRRFGACHRQYSLGIPFFQRFFDLAINGDSAGFVGMITANSFMKREFGKKLIEQYLRHWEMTHVLDSSGAYLPGHGTPTVVVFGRNRKPARSTVRMIRGIRGEPTTPQDPSQGLVWSSILRLLDSPGSEDQFISVSDAERELLYRHPWSIGGGGAAELVEQLDEEAKETLETAIDSVGFSVVTREDDAYLMPARAASRHSISKEYVLGIISGDDIRDWCNDTQLSALWPYDIQTLRAKADAGVLRILWANRCLLRGRVAYGMTQLERGLTWYEYSMFFHERFRTPLALCFAIVSTHNHFSLNRGGRVFKDSAPIIKFPPESSEDRYLELLGLLNSSLACFWLRQVCQPKGSSGIGRGVYDEAWEKHFAFNPTNIQRFPLPQLRPLPLAQRLDELAARHVQARPELFLKERRPTADSLAQAKAEFHRTLGTMIALQEELDWECYGHYGLLKEAPRCDYPPPIVLGQRAFEIALARQMARGEVRTTWFERHSSTPIVEIPDDWPEEYKKVVCRRIELIEKDRNIALIEKPEYKRRWNVERWDEVQERALRAWLLDRLEGWPLQANENGSRSVVWNEAEPRLISAAQLADLVRQDRDFMNDAALYRGREDFDVTKLVAELVAEEAVPALAVLRYKEPGLRKRAVWEEVWELQREEDAIDARVKLPPADTQYLTEDQAKKLKREKVGDIPVPPKYTSADMLPGPTWRLRGKLDVPKERFVSFPHCHKDADPTLVITWAGFNPLQQMQAIAAHYMDMKEREGWDPARREPLLAAMLELLPWVLQWHNDLDKEHQLKMGDYYRDFINDEAREMGKTVEEIKKWTPPAKARRTKQRQG